MRIHTMRDLQRLDQEQLVVQTPGITFDTASTWTITIDNGDDAPLIPAQVRLEMRERDVCFETETGGTYSLYYGDPVLSAPRYDLGQIVGFHVSSSLPAVAEAEEPNPEFRPRPDARSFTEQHPSLIWIGLIVVIAVLGGVAYRTAQGTRSSY
jgi:hypothetical protein